MGRFQLALIRKTGVDLIDITDMENIDTDIEANLVSPTIYVAAVLYDGPRPIKVVTYVDILIERANKMAYQRWKEHINGDRESDS